MTEVEIAHPPITTQKDWLAKRLELLAHEKELTKQRDRVHAERRRLPMVRIDKDYVFEGPDGKVKLLDLFQGRRQLIIHHFMYDPAWEKGCGSCTFHVKVMGDLTPLDKLDTKYVLVSRAPFDKLQSYKNLKGWTLDWYSSYGTDFNYDFNVTLDESVKPVEYNYRTKAELIATNSPVPTEGEGPGMSVFFRLGDEVFHTYSLYARGLEDVMGLLGLLDITPYGRQEDFEDSPPGWPQSPTYG